MKKRKERREGERWREKERSIHLGKEIFHGCRCHRDKKRHILRCYFYHYQCFVAAAPTRRSGHWSVTNHFAKCLSFDINDRECVALGPRNIVQPYVRSLRTHRPKWTLNRRWWSISPRTRRTLYTIRIFAFNRTHTNNVEGSIERDLQGHYEITRIGGRNW